MPNAFAVVDIGSNAMRLQVVTVDQPGIYRIVEQERRPVRLGHKVFETGALDPQSRKEALEVLKKFKATADRYKAIAIRGAATSAMREASDGPSFAKEAAEIGIDLQILPEADESRLISVGILSGLKFDPPLGLFMEIGGGSAELSVANRLNTFASFTMPLGAVRLTELFLKHDPPTTRELTALDQFAKQKLAPAVRRLEREKFTMAFGSGGTITSLADIDARLTGDAPQDSLYVLRRARLKGIFDLLRKESLQERRITAGADPGRADILVAGAGVLLSMMTAMELDYLFVSRRGLRDGLMIDLLNQQHPSFTGSWKEEQARAESLEEVGEKYSYDKIHCQHVARLANELFQQLEALHGLPERYARILHAAAMLHDIGLFIAYSKHHKHSYYLIKSSGPSSFDPLELDLVANVARYHRKAHPSPKHLPFSQLSAAQQEVVRKLAAILRIADALDYGHQSRVQSVECQITNPKKAVSIRLKGARSLEEEVQSAKEKLALMNEVFGVEVHFK